LRIVLEIIVEYDIALLRQAVSGQKARVMETEFNYDVEDPTSTILETERIVKIRKLNKKIGDNLKLLYGYRCQICGQLNWRGVWFSYSRGTSYRLLCI
jgi:hypothetical protein